MISICYRSSGLRVRQTASAIHAGIAFGVVAMRILPPLSPAIRTRRLLALTLADLRRLAKRASPGRQDDWQSRGFARLLAMPEQADPVERAELVSAVCVGKEIMRLRRVPPRFVPSSAVDAALQALAEGRSRGYLCHMGHHRQQLRQKDRSSLVIEVALVTILPKHENDGTRYGLVSLEDGWETVPADRPTVPPP